jgi:glycine/D-amino acid oxidase-like deaminating enzyme
MSSVLFTGSSNTDLQKKSFTIVGAGPVALGVALELQRSGVNNIQLLAQDIPRDEESARNITGGNAAGYGAPFATTNQEILECGRLSLPDFRSLANDPDFHSVAHILARTVTNDPGTVEFLENHEGFLRGPAELALPNTYELRAFAFNPRSLLVEWVRLLEESGCTLRQQTVTTNEWQRLLAGENPFGTDIALVCCGTGHNQFEPGKIVPVRGILAHIKDVQLDLSRVPVSAMYEDNLTNLVYLIPRPGRNGSWDLIVGGTFDMGEGECTEQYKQEVKNDRLVRARQLFAGVVPELMPHLDRAVDEISVGYRPRGADGAPITDHYKAEKNDVFVFNGMSGQGWVTVPERSRKLVGFIKSKI